MSDQELVRLENEYLDCLAGARAAAHKAEGCKDVRSDNVLDNFSDLIGPVAGGIWFST